MSVRPCFVLLLLLLPFVGSSQSNPHLFQPFTWEWPTGNSYRLGSGAPGPDYWQQQVDYEIKVRLEPKARRLTGSETITYHNNSPVPLRFLWVQLDQNLRDPQSVHHQMSQAYQLDKTSPIEEAASNNQPFRGGIELGKVTDENGKPLKHFVGGTNMRIDLEEELAPGEEIELNLDWSYRINDATIEGRSGCEYFPGDDNFIFEIAQFYPRMCAYNSEKGWQNRPFYGSGEFALEFGDYSVEITLPTNFLVAATGMLENEEEVLSKEQRKRLAALEKEPGTVSFIVSPAEAGRNETSKANGEKTWIYKAENVRDFAFAASKKFVWDAGLVEVGGKMVRAQSLYPREGMPLWDKYATHVVMHTLKTYSKYSVDYPYPQATAIHGPVWGMEYPMICFCGGRPQSTGYYSRNTKYRMIGVIMHEVGHNFFPMVVNSDERRWAWMDEGLNSFLEYLTEREWEPDFPHRRGPADDIAFSLMLSEARAIMTNPESIKDNGLISYAKTAAGLNLLRQLILGPENFDFAFREYARRWAFKHPEPADFFRSLEDASGQDLDWFWRGWFYGTGNVDFALGNARHYSLPISEELSEPNNAYPLYVEEASPSYYIDGRDLKDEYTGTKDSWDARASGNEKSIKKLLENFKPSRNKAFHVYQIEIKRKGEVVTPIVMQLVYADGSRENYRLPAQIWMDGRIKHTHEYRTTREVVAIHLDGMRILPDVDRSNNLCPQPRLGLEIEHFDYMD